MSTHVRHPVPCNYTASSRSSNRLGAQTPKGIGFYPVITYPREHHKLEKQLQRLSPTTVLHLSVSVSARGLRW